MTAYLSLMGTLCLEIKPPTHIPIGIFKNAITIFLTLICFVFAAKAQEGAVHSAPVAEVDAETNQSEIIPLGIGDRVPDELWDLPLQVINHLEGEETITLNDYRGKLIILDFWATWCSSCIAAMPEIHKLQEQFENDLIVLPVTTEDDVKTRTFLKTNIVLKDMAIASVVGMNKLGDYFPHKWLPHMVWIGTDGTVLATSSSNEITEQNIKNALENNIQVVSKIDIDYKQALFSHPSLKSKDVLLYSVFIKGYEPGLPSGSAFRRTDAGKIYGLAIYNATIGTIYHRLYRMLGENVSKSDIILNVKDTSAIWYNEKLSQDREWRENNLYTYELRLPVDQSEYLFERMIEDMDKYSGYHSKMNNGKIEISD